MPKKTLLETTIALLQKDKRKLPQIAASAGVGYFWLRNLKSGNIPCPGIIPIEKLHAALSKSDA